MVVAAYRHTYEQNLETSRGKCKGVAEEGTVNTRGRYCGIEPQNFLPCPRYSDVRDFTTNLRSTAVGNVYSSNERKKCITIMVVRGERPYILVEKGQNFAETHFLHFSFHSVFCLTTGPTPLPKRFLHIVRSRASSFK
jgi:hypothetical protein